MKYSWLDRLLKAEATILVALLALLHNIAGRASLSITPLPQHQCEVMI